MSTTRDVLAAATGIAGGICIGAWAATWWSQSQYELRPRHPPRKDPGFRDSTDPEGNAFDDILNVSTFLAELPKTDLHVHLDGSVRLSTLCELANQAGLIDVDEETLKQRVFKPHKDQSYSTLEGYLYGFQLSSAVMNSAANLRRISEELAHDIFSEGVRYFEVRFSPQLHSSEELSVSAAIEAVHCGLQRAQEIFNARIDATGGVDPVLGVRLPRFEFGIVVCALRAWQAEFSPYFSQLCQVHCVQQPTDSLLAQASAALVPPALAARDAGMAVVGLDLVGADDTAGSPKAANGELHKEAFRLAREGLLHTTVHTGQLAGPSTIAQTVANLAPDRIAHALTLFQHAHVTHINQPLPAEDISQLSISELHSRLCSHGAPDTRNWSRERLESSLMEKLAIPSEPELQQLEKQVRMAHDGGSESRAQNELLLAKLKRDNAVLEAKEHWVTKLSEYIAATGLTVEVCLVSNRQTAPLAQPCGVDLESWSEHPFRRMLDAKMSLTLCTDNRTISNTDMVREVHTAVTQFDLSLEQLRTIVLNGFRASFLHAPEFKSSFGVYQRVTSRNEYLRIVEQYYDAVVAKYKRRQVPAPESIRSPPRAGPRLNEPKTPQTPQTPKTPVRMRSSANTPVPATNPGQTPEGIRI